MNKRSDQPSAVTVLQKKIVKDAIVQFLPYVALLASTFLLYGKSIGFEFITNWDDREYVVSNQLIRNLSLDNFKEILTTTILGNFAPVHIMSYAVDFSLWGLNPRGYHLFNIVLHGLNACLVYNLLKKLTETKGVAIFAAFLFVVHPLNVENVAWISERKSLLAALFFLLALISYVKYCERRHLRYYFLCIFLFLLSVFSKASAVILPFVLILYDIYIREKKIKLLHLVPFFIISLLDIAIMIWAHFATKAMDKGTLSYDILFHKVYPTMTVLYWNYMRLIAAPFNLSGFYDAVIQDSFLAVPVLISFVAWISIFFVVLTKGSCHVRFWFLWFWICFLPTANIIPIPVYYADRYMYMPAIGFFVLIGLGLQSIISRINTKLFKQAVYAAATGIILFYGIVSFERLDVWKDELTFWQDVVAKSPNQDRGHLNLACGYEIKGRLIEAEQEYLKAIAIYPSEAALYNLKIVRAKIQFIYNTRK